MFWKKICHFHFVTQISRWICFQRQNKRWWSHDCSSPGEKVKRGSTLRTLALTGAAVQILPRMKRNNSVIELWRQSCEREMLRERWQEEKLDSRRRPCWQRWPNFFLFVKKFKKRKKRWPNWWECSDIFWPAGETGCPAQLSPACPHGWPPLVRKRILFSLLDALPSLISITASHVLRCGFKALKSLFCLFCSNNSPWVISFETSFMPLTSFISIWGHYTFFSKSKVSLTSLTILVWHHWYC